MVGKPGPVVLFGSGETSPSGRKVYEWLFGQIPKPPLVAVLETPAGFQPNSALVAEKVADFLRHRLQNYRPRVDVVPARKRGTPFSPDAPALLDPLLRADAIFVGPGSPTYAVRQLEGSLAWRYTRAQCRRGAALILASAATIAASSHALPVYEIYKVGSDLHWHPGLDLFGHCGLRLVFVPHWDNAEGGSELDTSRCFVGDTRFEQLLALLPSGATALGIDEHTALVVDIGTGSCRVMGRGGVTLLGEGGSTRFASGKAFPLDRLGPFHLPEAEDDPFIDARRAALAARFEAEASAPDRPPAEVLELVEERQFARTRRDWPVADALRERITSLGWQVADTPDGPELTPNPADSVA